MSEPELKPCPFCGEDNFLFECKNEEDESEWIRCMRCDTKGPTAWINDYAIAAWNKREEPKP